MNVADALPYFPAHLPLRERASYWRLPVEGTDGDVLIASLAGMCRALQCELGLRDLDKVATDPWNWVSLPGLLACLRLDLGHKVAVPSSLQRRMRAYFTISQAVSKGVPALHVARRICLADYVAVGSSSHLHYLGVLSGDDLVMPSSIPQTVFDSSAVFARRAETHTAPFSDYTLRFR